MVFSWYGGRLITYAPPFRQFFLTGSARIGPTRGRNESSGRWYIRWVWFTVVSRKGKPPWNPPAKNLYSLMAEKRTNTHAPLGGPKRISFPRSSHVSPHSLKSRFTRRSSPMSRSCFFATRENVSFAYATRHFPPPVYVRTPTRACRLCVRQPTTPIHYIPRLRRANAKFPYKISRDFSSSLLLFGTVKYYSKHVFGIFRVIFFAFSFPSRSTRFLRKIRIRKKQIPKNTVVSWSRLFSIGLETT